MTGILRGLRVVELGGLGPSMWACTFLSDMGADVIRVDRPGRDDLDFTENWMRGRARIEADLKDPGEAARVVALADRADVVVESFRPGVAERLGVGPERFEASNPRLIYTRLTGWGQDGPYAPKAGHDGNYIAIAGALATIGHRHDRPLVPVYYTGDWASGTMLALAGILGALYERERSGRGQVVDAAMVDGAALMLMQVLALRDRGIWVDGRESNQMDGAAWFYRAYPTSDGRFMMVGAIEPRFRELVRATLGLADEIAIDDPGRWERDAELVAAVFTGRTQAEWEDVFADVDACVTPVRELEDLERDPHLISRGVYRRIDGKLHPAPAPRFSRTPSRIPGPLDADRLVARWMAAREPEVPAPADAGRQS